MAKKQHSLLSETIPANGYSVVVSPNHFLELAQFIASKKYTSIFVLTDDITKKVCYPKLKAHLPASAHLITVKSGEENKNLASCQLIWDFLTKHKADRNAVLINLGGGVIGDLGGFAASVYKRGIDFIQVPTTLLAMADASIGGKTGIDYNGLKNHLGCFKQPSAIFIFTSFLESLPLRQITNGYAEIIKAAALSNPKWLKPLGREISPNPEEIFPHLIKAIQFKNKIVKKDPEEKNIRKALNFGHTIGHAIESYFLTKAKPLLHGEAVYIGMLIEIMLGEITKEAPLSDADFDLICAPLPLYPIVKIPESAIKPMLAIMKNDKKNRSGKINFTFIPKIGTFKTDCEASEEQIISAIKWYIDFVKELPFHTY